MPFPFNNDGGGLWYNGELDGAEDVFDPGASLMENSSIGLLNADYSFVGENEWDSGMNVSSAGDVMEMDSMTLLLEHTITRMEVTMQVNST